MHPRIPTLLHSKRHAFSASPLRCLPNEVVGIAFSFLLRHDLASVVRVCRSFHDEGQRPLYRFVELSSESKNVQETISLLGTVQVGAYVRGVVLTTASSHTAAYPAWFPPDVVQHWVGLCRLELSGVPFMTSQDMDVFRTTLQTHCRKLQILAYRHDPCLAFPGGESGLLGERRGTRDHVPDFGSANKSAHSLTHITFTGPVFHYLGSSFDTFLNLRFPNLKSLELGTLAAFSGSVPYATTIASVTRFIVEHNTIEHLSLSKRVPRDPDGVFFHLDGNLITADILPNLRSFEGCPAALTILARRGVASVFSLASLSLFAFEENLNDLSAVVGTIKSSPAKALTSVRNLKVEFFSIIIPPVMAEGVQEGVHAMSSNATSMRERHCLDDIAGVCPNVVNYSGTFPAMCAAGLKATFGLYPRLETISVPWYTLLIYMEPSGEKEYFAPLAESLPSLNTVVARKPRYTTFKDQVFTFVRNPSGELSQVMREEVRLAGSAF